MNFPVVFDLVQEHLNPFRFSGFNGGTNEAFVRDGRFLEFHEVQHGAPNLLEVGRGRQGSVITPKGAAFLQYIQQ